MDANSLDRHITGNYGNDQFEREDNWTVEEYSNGQWKRHYTRMTEEELTKLWPVS